MAPDDKREHTKEVLVNAAQVSQNYLSGRMLLILFLAILYSVGLSISGVQNAILISILAAFLSLIPYVGNVVGYVIAVVMSLIAGNGLTSVIGISATFFIAQFVESYILEPYVVGSKVDLNPVVTIIVVVLGEAVWGVVGMLVAIPVLGIIKVVFDNVSVLKPLGYLLGEEGMKDDSDEGDSIFTRTKQWAMNKFS
jgi:predicted PurR-regulated permease PerM